MHVSVLHWYLILVALTAQAQQPRPPIPIIPGHLDDFGL